ncbi:uncharacterized protein LOC128554702, partial [Mercenaria mercenaria]|uniref:uncharacterized protein LOC128554702 n=1 Tax=Mercenaria mercenaria TaxID=6596 RepID=UPI00234E756B
MATINLSELQDYISTKKKPLSKFTERYIRHSLLLRHGSLTPLKVLLSNTVTQSGKTLETYLRKEEKYFEHVLFDLKRSDDVTFNYDICTWDALTLCIVIARIFNSELHYCDLSAVNTILRQCCEAEHYSLTKLKTLSFKEITLKQNTLRECLLNILSRLDRNTAFRSKKLILSIELEPISDVVRLIEETNGKDALQTKLCIPVAHSGQVTQSFTQDGHGIAAHGSLNRVIYSRMTLK